jgi:hypothetical protein
MEFLLMSLAACGMAAIAAYAQFRIPNFTTGERKVLLTRGVLITVGAALGCLSARSFPNDPVLALLAFMIGFGVVHFPAAFILFVKQERGSGKT